MEDLYRTGEADATAFCSLAGSVPFRGAETYDSRLTCIFRQLRECSRVTVAYLARASSCGHTSAPEPESTPESSASTGGASTTGDRSPVGAGRGPGWEGGRAATVSARATLPPTPRLQPSRKPESGPSDEWWPQGVTRVLCARHSSRHWGYIWKQNPPVPDLPWEQISKRGFGLAVRAIP